MRNISTISDHTFVSENEGIMKARVSIQGQIFDFVHEDGLAIPIVGCGQTALLGPVRNNLLLRARLLAEQAFKERKEKQ